VGRFWHYRLAAVAAGMASAAELDLWTGAALRHVSDSVEQAGYWLA
jgi:hypothetical protein